MLTRFAPSPTGYLHVGNIRTALVCWIYARNKSGKFLLRFDDTDLQRSETEYITSIEEDLKWVGINWDLSFKQSERFQRYNKIFLQLISAGYIYACYETKEELEVKRKLQLKRGLPPVYDRSALFLTENQKNQYIQEGRRPHFRFKLNEKEVVKWNDEIKDEINIAVSNASDPIIKREDESYTYMLPSVIDDIDYNVTHVVRGEDHLTNTAVQIQMIQALKAAIPTFAHLSLLHFDDNKISKRYGGLNIRSIKKDEIEPMTLVSYLVKLGTSDPIEAYADIQSLVDSFDVKKFNSASTQFNLDEVCKLNSKVLQKMPFEKVGERSSQITSEFWYFIRNNIEKFSDAITWWKICKSSIDPIILNKEFVKVALDALPDKNFDENILSEWTKAIQQKMDISKKDLFTQLRLAITGQEKGPELAKLLTFIDRKTITTRLSAL